MITRSERDAFIKKVLDPENAKEFNKKIEKELEELNRKETKSKQ